MNEDNLAFVTITVVAMFIVVLLLGFYLGKTEQNEDLTVCLVENKDLRNDTGLDSLLIDRLRIEIDSIRRAENNRPWVRR